MSRAGREAWGRPAETLAAASLRLRGYQVIARRYRTPLGEIDLIVLRGRLLAFVEVKARADLDGALVALGSRQRLRTERSAQLFLASHPASRDHSLRFDVIAVRPWRLPHHLTDAWRPD
jgi:putative endonuclease